ncbi:MAG: NAD(P)-dependent alcohol dehydrogenase [Rhodobacteraceae bacterium]|nr:NAD(P)-dependent alcohol dehydrogenase [Paracoccaceae bacterium]
MKAAVYTKYGPPEVVRIADVPKPVPKPNQVLVKIHATAVNSSDWRLRSGSFPAGFTILARLGLGICGPRNKILGAELAGVVESVGAKVTRFNPGDRVFAGGGFGGHAEYKVVAQNKLAMMPVSLSFKQAGGLAFGGTTALYFLHDLGQIKAGQKVLINGASGNTGLAAIQIAKHAKAEVWAVCSARNFDLVKSMGADHVIDYTVQDITKSGQKFDIIYDSAGTAPWPRVKDILTSNGRLLIVLGSFWEMVQAPFVSRKSGKSAKSGTSSESSASLEKLADMVDAGDFQPVIDRCYAFADIVDAHAYVDTGRKRGSVVILVDEAVKNDGNHAG